MADKKGKTVTISTEDFEKMTTRIQEQDTYIEELEEANKFLNSQIEEYNQKFTGKGDQK